jgi:hypothetical protein
MVDLTREERRLLATGVAQWGGAARPNDAIATALGVGHVDALTEEGSRLLDKLRGDEELTDDEAAFALHSTELVFVSDRWGCGVEWETITGYSDAETVSALRDLQRKLVGAGA